MIAAIPPELNRRLRHQLKAIGHPLPRTFRWQAKRRGEGRWRGGG